MVTACAVRCNQRRTISALVLMSLFFLLYTISPPAHMAGLKPMHYTTTKLGFNYNKTLKKLRNVENICNGNLVDRSRDQSRITPFTGKALRAESEEGGYQFLSKNPNYLNTMTVDEEHKIIYCYVPKVACTNWKKIMMILTKKTNETDPSLLPGYLPHMPNSLKYLNEYSQEDILHMLRTFSKFMFAREPIERLLSAFRNKFVSTKSKDYFRKKYGVTIQTLFRKGKSVSPEGLNTTFSEFVHFLVRGERYVAPRFNEHWRPMVQICQPCLMKYDFIGSYETINEDSEIILREIGAPKNLKLPYKKQSKTKSYLGEYLLKLSEIQIEKMQQIYAEDTLMFGYSFDVVKNATSNYS